MTVNGVFFSVVAETGYTASALVAEAEPGEPGLPRIRKHTLARALLRHMLVNLWPIGSSDVRICEEATGRPFLAPIGSTPLPFISLSHSGGWVGCAASDIGPVGIDLERPRRDRNLTGIAEAAFGPKERERARDTGSAGFYRIWTLREAIAKATGEGLALATDCRDRVDQGPEDGTWQMQIDARSWSLSHRTLTCSGDMLHLAVAAALPFPLLHVSVEPWECQLRQR
jgi:phosphopantetheinyl transferase